MPLTVALVTWHGLPELTRDDRLLVEALAERGIGANATVWDRADERWDRYALVLLRSCWDYHLKADAFRAWLDGLEGHARLWNPPGTVRWNMDKRYLRRLYERVDGPETIWVEHGMSASAFPSISALGWERVVVKPTVSATAHMTFLIAGDDMVAYRAALTEITEHCGALIQPFLSGVLHEGEWSLCFVAGEFSHAVIKRPRPGDFRVQACFGGTHAVGSPPLTALAVARRALATVDQPWLYARVDGVMTQGRFLLLELELIEPSLYLDSAPGSADRLADAIVGLLP